ncbi:MAG: response regulator [Pseudomonadota bacterium]
MNAVTTNNAFFSRAGQALQSAVGGMLGVIELLENTRLDKEQLEYIHILKNSVMGLTGIMSGFQAYSAIDSEQTQCSVIDFDLRTMLMAVQEAFDHKIQTKGLNFIVSIHHLVPSLLKGDPERLRQILTFLLDNAATFTRQGYIKVSVILEQENKTHATIRFEIADTGIGIEAHKLQALFESTPPGEGNGACQAMGLAGIGLTMSKKLIRLMGGEINASSSPGQGSVFRFVIKFEKQRHDSESRMVIPGAIKNKKVLIVDNDTAHRMIVKTFLKSWGCQFDEAVNAKRALEKLGSAQQSCHPFEIVLIDMQLPDINGEDLARQITTHPQLSGSLIIMFAAGGKRGDVSRLTTIGVHGYLPKPTPAPLLFDCITMALAMSRQERREVITRHFIKENQKQQFGILLIDAGRVNQKMVKNILEKSGYQLKISQTSQEALDLFLVDQFQMVLIEDHGDLKPEAIIQQLRRIEQGQSRPATRIVLIAGGTEPFQCPSGCDGTVSLPLTSDNLLMAIEGWMGQAEDKDRGKPLFQRVQGLSSSKDMFDLEAALDRAMDDASFLKILVDEFICSFPDKLAVLKSSMNNNDFKTFTQRIYSLRSSALNIGSNSISTVALELEKYADAGDIKTAGKHLNLLEEAVEQFKIHIQTIDWSRV